MDKRTAQELIEKTFNNAFSEKQFTVFAKNLLNDFEDKHNHYSGNLIWDDYKEHINTYKRIGKYVDPNGEALDIRDKYQYFTQANMVKTIGTGYKKQFFSLEEGVNDYVKNYLIDQRFF
jgi:hypothetical protein